MKCYKITSVGKVKNHNEDFAFASLKKIGNFDNLFIVADGVSNEKAGEVASKLSIKYFIKELKSNDVITNMVNARLKNLFQSAIANVSRKIFELSREKDKYRGMCSTFLACTIKNNTVYAANVGDSRLYIITTKIEMNENGDAVEKRAIRQITKDDTEVVESRIIPSEILKSKNKDINIDNLETIITKRKYLTKAVGAMPDLTADYYEIDLKKKIDEGKKVAVLLCTDGLCDELSDDEMLSILAEYHKEGKKKINELVRRANQKGGHDNMTCILVEL